MPKNALRQLDLYLAAYPDEKEMKTHSFLRADLERSGEAMLARDFFPGHITTSAFVLDPEGTSAALIYHRQLQRWLQPGGHYDGDSSLLVSARRELTEETGIADVEPILIKGFLDLPLDIDSHPIPGRPARGEPDHVHHDYAFLFRCTSKVDLSAQLSEVEDARWMPLEEVARLPGPRFHRLAQKAISALRD